MHLWIARGTNLVFHNFNFTFKALRYYCKLLNDVGRANKMSTINYMQSLLVLLTSWVLLHTKFKYFIMIVPPWWGDLDNVLSTVNSGSLFQFLDFYYLMSFLIGNSRPLFFYIFVFSKQLTINNFSIFENRRWLDANFRPLVSEVTALPTEPQPLPYLISFTITIITISNSSGSNLNVWLVVQVQ